MSELSAEKRKNLEDRVQLINTTLDAIEAAGQWATPTVNLIYTAAYDALLTELGGITAKLEGRPYLTHEEALHLIDLGNEHTEKLYADILALICVLEGTDNKLAVTLFNRLWAAGQDRIELAFKNYLAENE